MNEITMYTTIESHKPLPDSWGRTYFWLDLVDAQRNAACAIPPHKVIRVTVRVMGAKVLQEDQVRTTEESHES